MAMLRPIDLKTQPAPYQDRYKILQRILEVLQKFNGHSVSVEKKAIELEASIATKSASKQSYRFNVSVLLRDLVKTNGDLTKLKNDGLRRRVRGGQGTTTVLSKKADVIEKLKEVLLAEDLLVQNGYITKLYAMSPEESVSSSPYISCHRCSTKFKKDEIMEKTMCRYHLQKKRYNRETKTEEFPCCGESTGSPSFMALGCKTLDYHVYRSETFHEMSQISAFKKTSNVEGDENVLALDCEMGYTSLGYEMIRLTIVDFFTNSILFDEIIQPFGEIIDLNTEFSGVHMIDKDKTLTFSQALPKFLGKSLINKNSILIGHGLENDLNVLRIIHDKIIDTAILYPHGKFKSSLKNLAFQELSRRIQSGEHDSSEDAIASMDVVKVKLGIPLDHKEWI